MGKKKKSAKASGFSIKRSRGAFNCSWKLSGKAKKQQWRQKLITVGQKKAPWPKKGTDISAKAKDKRIPISYSKYYPTTKTLLKSVAFQIREKNKKWTGWKGAKFVLAKPRKPSITKEQVSAYSTKFTITLPEFVNDKKYWTTHIQYWTCLRIDQDDKNYETIPDKEWKKMPVHVIHNSITGDDKTTIEPVITETDDEVRAIRAAKKSAVRWVKAVAQGPRGDSAVAESCITYTKSLPIVSLDTQVSVNPKGGYDCTVGWACINSIANPIDYMMIQYAFAEPYGTDMKPSSPSPQEAQIGGDNKIVPLTPEEAYVALPDDEENYIFLIEDEEDEEYDDDDDEYMYLEPPVDKDYLKYIVSFHIPDNADPDKLLYVRVNTYHNNVSSDGEWILCNKDSQGNETIPLATVLSAPSGLQVDQPSSPGSNLITVNVSNTSNVEDVYLVIRWMPEEGESAQEDIAVFMVEEGNNNFSEAVEIPDNYEGKYKIGAYAAVGDIDPSLPERKAGNYNSYGILNPTMKSKLIHYGGEVPIPPEKPKLTHIGDGNVQVEWKWDWKEADSAEIAWSDYSRALESTNQPNTHEVSNINKSVLIVRDLEMGKTWYFWVRLTKKGTASAWSEISQIAVNSAPQIPVVELSSSFLTQNDTLTVNWDYVSTDGTEQKSAVVAAGTMADNVFVPNGNPIAYVPNPNDSSSDGKANSVVVNPFDPNINWEVGKEYYVAVNVTSESGVSSGWSEPAKVSVVEPLVCTINEVETSLVRIPDVDDTETHYKLTELPLTIKVDGADEGNETYVYIRRLDNYFVDRPDGSDVGGYKNEIVYFAHHSGSDPFVIELADIQNYYGYLDDTAPYYIYAEVGDNYGRLEPCEKNVEFVVEWDRQAQPMDDGEGHFYAHVVPDNELKISKITIDDIPNWAEGDVCDIYRLTLDEVQLIYEGAVPGQTIVDMYPTLGKYGGHRIAYRSIYGDFITAEGTPAYIDIEAEHGNYIKSSSHIIDFGPDRVELEYNVDLSNQWRKDFKETHYLGGSIRGDWNDGVTRTGSISASFVTDNADLIRDMRKLAEYSSECIVRTTDGSHYVANVDVSENMPHDEYYNNENLVKMGSYSLSLTRVDSDDIGMGVTEEEWEEMNRDEETEG